MVEEPEEACCSCILGLHSGAMHLIRKALDEIPPEHRPEVRRLKAQLLHDVACAIQDQLDDVTIYLGDDPLINAKKGIQEACARARRVAEKVLRDC